MVLSQPQFELTAHPNRVNLLLAEGFGYIKGDPIPHDIVTSKHPERFGKGAIEGVAAPEAANNSAATGSFIPLLTLGIPGNASIAMIFVALLIHGVRPGPLLVTEKPDVFWGLIASMYIGSLMLLVLNLPLIGLWVKLLRVPYPLLAPLILTFVIIGSYSVNNSIFDVGTTIAFGVFGYLLRKFDFEPAP